MLRRIILLNPKGGSGKTTIATNLAAYFASTRRATVLIDRDSQGSSTRWLELRPDDAANIHGIPAYREVVGVTRSWQMRLPSGTERVVIDTPAGMGVQEVAGLLKQKDTVLVPVLPSRIDIDAAAEFVRSLMNTIPVRQRQIRVAVVANRVRINTRLCEDLERFLFAIRFPFIAKLREAEKYLSATELGLGIHELRRSRTRRDREQWAPLLAWLGERVSGASDVASKPVVAGTAYPVVATPAG